MIVRKPSVTLEWATPDPVGMVARAARTCYKSEAIGDQAEFVSRLITRGHESTIEHAVASLRIVCDRGVSHEIVRHRIASYSQESTRYCNYSNERFGGEISVIAPTEGASQEWFKACANAEQSYFAMLAEGYKPQHARAVLPNSLATELVMTTNARSWRNFIALRTAPQAHPDMRHVANMVKDVLLDAGFGPFLEGA